MKTPQVPALPGMTPLGLPERKPTKKRTSKYRVEGEELSHHNLEALRSYVAGFHVAYTWRYVWRQCLTKKFKGLERFKRAVAPNLRAKVVWYLRLCVANNKRTYVDVMRQMPLPDEKMVRQVMMGQCKPEDVGL